MRRPSFSRALLAAAFAVGLAAVPGGSGGSGRAFAQIDSREGIALQNQILQLRQELEMLRRSAPGATGTAPGGYGLGAPVPMAPPVTPGTRSGAAAAPSAEILNQLVDRVSMIEEELRRLRGRAEEAEYRNRTLQEEVEKLRGDFDFRLQQLEGTGGGQRQGSAPASRAAPTAQAAPAARPSAGAAAPAASSAPRPPERALAEGQAALQRRNYTAAEAAAREVLAQRGNNPRAYDARFLLADALAGRGNWQQAAIEYGEAYGANPRGSRAGEALVGFGDALARTGQRREACEALNLARSENPNMRGALREKLDAARQRAGCR